MTAWLLAATTIAPCKPVAMKPTPAKVVWTLKSDVKDARLAGGKLILELQRHVRAVDPATGTILWERSIAHASASGRTEPMVVAADRIYVALGSELLVLSLRDGTLLSRVAMPRWIRMLEGPPLIAVANNEPMLGSTMYALDENGRVRARRLTRRVEAMWFADDVVIARLTRNQSDEGSELKHVAAFRARDLQPLWSFRMDGGELQQIGGRWYVGDTQWDDMHPLDPATGRRGPPLPPKEPTDQLWGGATWEVETVIASSAGEPTCERVRVNDPATGKPRLQADLPFTIGNTLRHGDAFYVTGEHYLARISFRTGKVERIWNGIPMLLDHFWIERGLLIGAGIAEGAVALRVD